MNIDFSQYDLLTWITAITVGLVILVCGALLLYGGYKLAGIIYNTSIDPATKEISATSLQRWIAFVVLMFLFIISHIEITLSPVHFTPQPVGWEEALIILAFVITGKAVKVWEGKPTTEASEPTQVIKATTTVTATPVTQEAIKVTKEAETKEPDFVLKNE